MTAKNLTPSSDISASVVFETTTVGVLSGKNGLPAELTPLDSTAGAADITRLPGYWKSKDTVNELNDPTYAGKFNSPEVKNNLFESDSKAIQTENSPVENSPGTDARSTTSNDLGSNGPSNSLELSAPANDTPTMFAGNWNIEQVKSLIGLDIGPYVVTGELGQGGMGVVYKARHKLLRRDVALKIILGSLGNSEVISRFRKEARSVATLKHPGIVQLHEYGEHQGIPWCSLEFVNGKTLAQLIAIEPLDPWRAARIIADVASAVGFAHDRGVTHRDIKPANVLIADGDIAKLTDFGLAKQVTSDTETSKNNTIEGQIMGTPGFMPPEQARGRIGQTGPYSDQYSLGATLYCILTGRAPFVGAPLDVVMQVINDDPLTVRQLQPSTPLDLETICLKAMSKEPARRYPDCAAFEADLRRFLRHEPIVARPVGQIERVMRWCRHNPKVAIPVLTTALSVLTALGISVWSAVTLSAKNSAIQKRNQEIVEKNEKIELQKSNAETLTKMVLDRGVAAKDAVAEIMTIIRVEMPSSEEKLRKSREKLLRRSLELLNILPDNPSDSVLRTGLEKARVLQEQYHTALDLGEPSKAIEYLDAAETILRERNSAIGRTDASRKNLQVVLYHQTQARTNAQRNMEKVCQICDESVSLLNDVLDHPNPAKFDAVNGSIPRLDILTAIMIQGYRHALTLKNLGRVDEGLAVLDSALKRFDEAMSILRAGPFSHLTDEQWNVQLPNFRGMLSDQDQLRAILLAAVGRDQEASAAQASIMTGIRQLAASQPTIENSAKLSLALLFAGDLARQRGQIDEAIKAYEESVTITRELYLDNSRLDDRRSRHNVSLMRLAGLVRFQDLARARELYAEAQKVAREMVQADDKAIGMYVALALVSPFSGPPRNAVELAEEILQRVEPGTSPDAELLVNVARVFAASADAEVLTETPDTQAIEQWKTRALTSLTDAVKAGYRDAVFLAGEPDLTSLRSEPKFKELLKQCRDKSNE